MNVRRTCEGAWIVGGSTSNRVSSCLRRFSRSAGVSASSFSPFFAVFVAAAVAVPPVDSHRRHLCGVARARLERHVDVVRDAHLRTARRRRLRLRRGSKRARARRRQRLRDLRLRLPRRPLLRQPVQRRRAEEEARVRSPAVHAATGDAAQDRRLRRRRPDPRRRQRERERAGRRVLQRLPGAAGAAMFRRRRRGSF